ncbi:MlaD family protein [Puniceicoccus vermicola]|uniref:MCE family protein n=1 Tax=Puniceicoccus vermicola TaxID=388746 RepID=A0A7X1E4D8_9BACT|nr:MlaD family protein [Puniceicoccus vermicola]MBC2602031.1 MCE family protein [Puniceicoccus vermicola]
MSDKAQYSGVGLFFIIGLVITYFVYTSLNKAGSASAEGYPIDAPFNNILQLRVGDDVRMSGVKVGTVIGTSLKEGQAVAKLSIQKQYEIPTDSVASVSMAGLLGTNFVSIEMGKSFSDPLKPGEEIKTKPSVDINQIFEEVGAVADRIDGALSDIGGMFSGQGDGLFAELGGMIKENRGRIGSSLENIEIITTQLSEGKGTVGKLLFEDEGYNELMATVAEIKSAAGQADEMLAGVQGIVDHVKSGEGSLGELLYGDQIANELKSTIANVQEFSARLNDPNSTIGRLLSDDTIYFEVQSVVRKASRTLDSVNDSGPISAVGVVTGALF